MRKSNTKFAVRRSRTGLGLFTLEEIEKGSNIIQYTGKIICNEEVERHRGKYLFTVDAKRTIDGSCRTNTARYVNHSCRPNSEAIIIQREIWFVAKRKIKPLEEITIHYGKAYFNDYIKTKGCKCNKCRNRSKQNAQSEELQL